MKGQAHESGGIGTRRVDRCLARYRRRYRRRRTRRCCEGEQEVT